MKRISIIFCIIAFLIVSANPAYPQIPFHPILRDSAVLVGFSPPKEQRDERYIKFLSASVKISVQSSSGSGTICYYDQESNWAYVISCGHMWQGEKSYDRNKPGKAQIIAWYKNGVKLPQVQSYEAEVLFWSNKRGFDSSLLRFHPDWRPQFFPIASNFEAKKGMMLNSLGCDGGYEVARYEVKVLEFKDPDIITEKNSPRPGRSGGGLLTNEGEFVGICWGTSELDGTGIGFFTPLSSIKTVFSKNKHEWILKKRMGLESMPIYDWDRRKRIEDDNFIPMPNFLLF